MRRSLLVFAAFVALSATACKKEKSNVTQDCTTVFCTAEVVTIYVVTEDGSGNPVGLDEYYTIRKKTGEVVMKNEGGFENTYPVLTDAYRKQLAFKTEDFEFVGRKNGRTVVRETFTMTADCCHIANKSDNGGRMRTVVVN